MKRALIFTALAALAVVGSLNAASARTTVEGAHAAGDPIQRGDRCWAIVNPDSGTGYWDDCTNDRTTLFIPRARTQRQIDIVGGSGGGGGGPGGGGGGAR